MLKRIELKSFTIKAGLLGMWGFEWGGSMAAMMTSYHPLRFTVCLQHNMDCESPQKQEGRGKKKKTRTTECEIVSVCVCVCVCV